jgi:hypothetical protein
MTQAQNNAPDPQPPKGGESLQDKLGTIVIKALMTGGVTVGGAGAFWSLFKDSDIPKAIASGAIGVGITYGASLLSPLHEGNKRRLENIGKVLDRVVDKVGQALAGKVTRLDVRYLELQKEDCQTSVCDGISQVFTPLLEEIFVPLSVTFTEGIPGWRQLQSKGFQLESFAIDGSGHCDSQVWQFLKNAEADSSRGALFRRMAILAWGGYGKTTLLRHIAYIYSNKQHGKYGVKQRFPVFLALKTYGKIVAQTPEITLTDVIMKHHVPRLARDLNLPEDWAKSKLKKGEILLLLDGFDEVAEAIRPQVSQWLKRELDFHRKTVAILTSRPKAYDEQPPASELKMLMRIWVEPFNASQQAAFVNQWYRYQLIYANNGRSTSDVMRGAEEKATQLLTQIRERAEIEDLAKIPLLLNMIATLHRLSPHVELPKRRVELYQAICQMQLFDRPGAKQLETLLPKTPGAAQTILQRLALEMVLNNREKTVERSVLLDRLTKYLTAENETVSAADFLREVVRVSELLIEREVNEFEFAHWSFQEYLAAKEIFDRKQEKEILDRLSVPEWKPLITMYSSLLKNPTDLIRSILDQGLVDLARICLQETPKQVDPILQQALEQDLQQLNTQVTNSTYAKLEELLKSGKWEEADRETDRVMLEVAGQTERGYLMPDDLKNFPCEDLLTIDKLWVEASNGHFGFSVQKNIWQECGSPMSSGKNWDRFCDRVGWKVKGKYVGYDDLRKNPSLSPAGELPRMEGEGRILLVSLFSRSDL